MPELSEQHKKNISLAHKGMKRPKETGEKISMAKKGKLLSEENKRKLSESHKGKKMSEEYKKKISEAMKGKKKGEFTKEHKEKLSKAKKRNPTKYWLGKKRPEMSGESHPFYGRDMSGENNPMYGKERPEIKGEKNPNWNGGTSRAYKTGYWSIEYRHWRQKVFNRDDYTCQECGFHGSKGYITAHHIKSFSYYPELRFDINNGVTLCEECHKKTDNYKGRANKITNNQVSLVY